MVTLTRVDKNGNALSTINVTEEEAKDILTNKSIAKNFRKEAKNSEKPKEAKNSESDEAGEDEPETPKTKKNGKAD